MLDRLINNNAMLDLCETNFEISSTVVRNASEYDEQVEIFNLTMDDDEAVVEHVFKRQKLGQLLSASPGQVDKSKSRRFINQ